MRKMASITVLTAAAVVLALFLGGCGSSNKEGASAPVAQPTATGNLQAQVVSVSGGNSPVVTFRLFDENGAPLDPNELLTPTKTVNGVLPTEGALRFFIARIKPDGNYQNYKRASDNAASPNFFIPSYEGAAAARLADAGGGAFTYTFKLNLDNAAQTLYPPGGTRGITLSDNVAGGGTARGLTHTVAIQARRVITLTTGKTQQTATNPYFNYRPDGGVVTMTREVAPISTCNECHKVLGLHGGSRRDVALCILCHYPGINDPTTGNSIDMKVMIHRIHMGENLPSNKAGGAFFIGNSGFDTVTYPFISGDNNVNGTPADCVKCHKAGTNYAGNAYGKDVARYKAGPTKNKCTTCHDTVTFDGSTTIVVLNNTTPLTVPAIDHAGQGAGVIDVTGAQADNAARCAECHDVPAFANAEYDISSVPAAHTILERSSVYTGVNFKILSVDNAIAGRQAIVTLTIKTDNGTNILAGASGNSFNIKLGYMPASVPDYTNNLLNNFGQPLTKSLTSVTPNADGSYTATFDNVIPATASGVGVIGLEGRASYALPGIRSAQSAKRVGGQSAQFYFNVATGAQVTNPASTRRKSVDVTKCQACHARLSIHGANRVNSIEECVICHNPSATDRNQRVYPSADNLVEQSIDFKVMIHRIHTGEQLDPSQKPYIIYGNGNSVNDFSDVTYPRDRMDCLGCHIDTTPVTFGIPLAAGVMGTSLSTGALLNDVSDDVRKPPMQSVCMACHSDSTFAFASVHVASQTSGSTEFCATCHTTGLLLGPDFAHQPIRPFPAE